MLIIPMTQLVLISFAFSEAWAKRFPESKEVSWGEGLCPHFSSDVKYTTDKISSSIMFFMAVLSLRLDGQDWQGIGFHVARESKGCGNVAILIAAKIVDVVVIVLQLTLYMLFIESPHTLDVIFNCVALNFVMSLDLMLAQGMEVELNTAKKCLSHINGEITEDEKLLFCADNKKNLCIRGVNGLIWLAGNMLRFACVLAIPACV